MVHKSFVTRLYASFHLPNRTVSRFQGLVTVEWTDTPRPLPDPRPSRGKITRAHNSCLLSTRRQLSVRRSTSKRKALHSMGCALRRHGLRIPNGKRTKIATAIGAVKGAELDLEDRTMRRKKGTVIALKSMPVSAFELGDLLRKLRVTQSKFT